MQSLETKPLLVDTSRITLRITHEEFELLCQDNPDLRLELTANGELVTMSPARFHPQVEIYRLGQEKEVLQSPTTPSGEDVLPGFVLDLSLIW